MPESPFEDFPDLTNPAKQVEAAHAAEKPAAKEVAATSAPAAQAAVDPTSRQAIAATSAKASVDSFVKDTIGTIRSLGQLPPGWGDHQIEDFMDLQVGRDRTGRVAQVVANRAKDPAAFQELLGDWARQQRSIVGNVQSGLPVGYTPTSPEEVAKLARMGDRAFKSRLQDEIWKAEAAQNAERKRRGQPTRWST